MASSSSSWQKPASSSQQAPESTHQLWGKVEIGSSLQPDSSSGSADDNVRTDSVRKLLSNVQIHDNSSTSGSGSQESQGDERRKGGNQKPNDKVLPAEELERLRKAEVLERDSHVDAFGTKIHFAPGERVGWSVGSAGHHEFFTKRTCKPCAWNWKQVGCSKGESCDFCHMCVEGEFTRKKQMQRLAQRRNQLRSGGYPSNPNHRISL
eukprot:TRINITY_DN63866_c0_g1_i1.p1 TRINITY_DN63866_c0_g1~~TRINITY_DN63866_c0_g1_i1.p1  ORF type:complete len:208 (-),score=21.66 TRINITY_DN63866_c0_g1_i1:28-651(-)